MALTVVCAYLGHEPWLGAGKRDADPLLCPRGWKENGADDPAVVMTKGPRTRLGLDAKAGLFCVEDADRP